jgi:hypothetical protein
MCGLRRWKVAPDSVGGWHLIPDVLDLHREGEASNREEADAT